MVHISQIEARLSQMGFRASRWFRPEIRELQHILMDDEQIIECVQGRYFGGFALLVATDYRLLLIDKKIPYLSVEDIRYDMVAQINFGSQWFDATVTIFTFNKQHRFSSWKQKQHLRNLTTYAQRRVTELRQYQQPTILDQPQPYMRTAPSMTQSYNYGQMLQLQPPLLSSSIRQRLPSPHVPRIVGAAAVNGARHLMPNPYAGGSLVMHRQVFRTSSTP